MAVLNIQRLAALAAQPKSRLTTLVIGVNDLEKDTGVAIGAERAFMTPWLMNCVLAAKAYRLRILDGVYNDFSDEEGYAAQCREGRAMGMDGKTLIHPAQIDVCNEIFSPSMAELAQAAKIIAAFEDPENQGLNVLSIDNCMVERLHYETARQLVAFADQIGQPLR